MAGETPSGSQFVRTLDCPNCGGKVQVRAQGFSLSAACSHCLAILDVSSPSLKILEAVRQATKLEPRIPLGTRGELFGTVFEVIGFMQREDQEKFTWREYLLFNPRKGFGWLVEFQYHWSYITMLTQRDSKRRATFRHYSTGTAKVNYVLGEFYWRVKRGETVEVIDLINPPEIYSEESNGEERTASFGVYVDKDVIEKAFKVRLPEPVGISPCQPNPHDKARTGLVKALFLVVPILLVAQMISPTPSAENFFFVGGIVLLAPVMRMFLAANFENHRWHGQSLIDSWNDAVGVDDE